MIRKISMLVLLTLILSFVPAIKSTAQEPGTDDPPIKKCCKIASSSCPDIPNDPGISHVFSKQELGLAVQNMTIEEIVIHGEVQDDGLNIDKTILQTELVPIFISNTRRCANLTSTDLRKILNGEITQWDQLACGTGAIQLYLHDGKLQRKKAEKWFASEGISVRNLRTLTPKYYPTYESLENSSAQDPNALVIGIKNLTPDGLKTVSIDGIPIENYIGSNPEKQNQIMKMQKIDYPFQITIYTYSKRNSIASISQR